MLYLFNNVHTTKTHTNYFNFFWPTFCLSGLIVRTAKPIFIEFSLEDRESCGAICRLLFDPIFPRDQNLRVSPACVPDTEIK